MAITHQPLVVVGSVNADLAVQLDRLPSPGETLSASTLEFFPGGLLNMNVLTKFPPEAKEQQCSTHLNLNSKVFEQAYSSASEGRILQQHSDNCCSDN